MPRKPKVYGETPENSAETAISASFTDLATEFKALVALCRKQREKLERALDQKKGTRPDKELTAQVGELGRLVTQLLKEGRQLEKQYGQLEISDAQTVQILIAAGWTPPKVAEEVD